MQATGKQIAKALMKSLSEGNDPAKLSKSFEKYLTDNHLIGLAPNIIVNLERELAEHEKKKSAVIATSHSIPPGIVKDIEKLIGKDSDDKTKLVVDENLVGGFKAVYKGKVFDGSVRNYLKELRSALTQ